MNSQFPNRLIHASHSCCKPIRQKHSPLQSSTHPTAIPEQSTSTLQSSGNATGKLLQLEKQLALEAIYNEKQRTLIDILKQILNENMDDCTILTYISTLEEQLGREDERYQMGAQLQQIKIIMDRKNSLKKKNHYQRDLMIDDLKKQIKQLREVKKELMEDFQNAINEKDTLETEIKQLKDQNTQLNLKVQYLISQQQINQSRSQMLQKQNSKLKEKDEEFYRQLRKLGQIQGHNCDKNILIQNIQIKLKRYQDQCKELSSRLKSNFQSIKLHSVIRLFLSTQVIKIVEEYQKTHQDCLLKQLQNLCRLQQNKKQQLENCQQEMWRWRVKSLRSEDTWGSSQRKNRHGTKTKENSIDIGSREVSEFKE